MKKYLVLAVVLILAGFSVVGAQTQPSVNLGVENVDGPFTVPEGTAVTLHWSTQNVSSCNASGAWSGSRDIAGSETTVPLSIGSYTYTLSCTDGGTMVTDSVTVIVQPGAVTEAPSVELLANNQGDSLTVASSTAVTLSWSTQDATACSASGAWSGARLNAGSETVGTFPAGSSRTFTLTCTGPGGETSDTVVVNVSQDQVSTPSVDLKVNGQDSATVQGSSTASTTVTLSWTSNNVNSCAATGDWTGAKATSGSETITLPPTGTTFTRNYTLSCSGNSTVTDTVSVTLQAPGGPSDPLVITNVRVTDVARTSVVVRWTTNRAATSQVVYDTVSRPGPFSTLEAVLNAYAFETSVDANKVTEHAVTVTGLNPGTRYYFRVISED